MVSRNRHAANKKRFLANYDTDSSEEEGNTEDDRLLGNPSAISIRAQNRADDNYKVNIFEICSWVLSNTTLGLWYNQIGVLAAWRGIDYSSYITLPLDHSLPQVDWLIIPYVIVYFMPVTYVLCCLYDKGVNGSVLYIRRFYQMQMTLMACCYALYVIFPVSIESLALVEPSSNAPVLQHLTYTFVHTGMTTFCALPSMHVAHCLSMAWIQSHDELSGAFITYAFAIITCFSTVLTKAHFLMDVFTGIVLAYLFDRQLFVRLCSHGPSLTQTANVNDIVSNSRSSKNMSVSTSIWHHHQSRIVFMVFLPIFTIVGNIVLFSITGVRTDVIGMFSGKKLN